MAATPGAAPHVGTGANGRLPAGARDWLAGFARDLSSWRAPRARAILFTLVAALALRIVLLPLGHWWDLTVDYNVFIDLAHGQSPYDTLRQLANISYSAHWQPYYEYYAYPPAPLYLYWPLAHLFAWLHPGAAHFFPVQRSFAMPILPWDFYLWFKLPVWLADFAIGALLVRLTGSVRAMQAYLLNPFVLLISGAWTFDALMVLGLVLGAYWLLRGRPALAGAALAVGTMIKFVPAILLPVFALYLIKQRRPPRQVAALVSAFTLVCAVLVGPYLGGVLDVLGFHSARSGGGMNWETLLGQLPLFGQPAGSYPLATAVGAYGTPALIVALLIVYGVCYVAEMPLSRMVLLTLVTYLVATKLVNEQYVLAVVPFTLIEARRLRGVWVWIHHAVWATALTSAVFSVPIDRFLWPLYYTVFGARAYLLVPTGATGLDTHYFPWRSAHLDGWAITALGVWFTLLCLAILACPPRGLPERVRARLPGAPRARLVNSSGA